MENIILKTKNTWCPGCGNFGMQSSLKEAIEEIGRENTVLVSGIGCHGKMADYMNVSSFYALHGRAVPAALGVKIGNSDLDVICNVGDGDVYSEGVAHLIHAAKRNSNITVIVHDNHAFSLTVKQPTATSPEGFIGSSSPKGHIEKPINPLDMMLSVNASFVARGFTGDVKHLKDLMLQGVRHKGFSFIEVLQPCIAWYNTFSMYNERTYKMEDGPFSLDEAREKVREWDYMNKEDIPLGVFYKEEREVFEEKMGEVGYVDVEGILESKRV